MLAYIAFCAVMLVVIFVGTVGSATAAGVMLLIGSVVFLIYRGVTNDKGLRPCPRCGEGVEIGVLDCPYCEFDFRTIGAPSDPEPAARRRYPPPPR
jgi:hypothetical protein